MSGDLHGIAWLLGKLSSLVDAGGNVMWPLLAVGLLTWTLLLLRAMSLQDAKRALRRWVVAKDGSFASDDPELVFRLKSLELRRHAKVIDTLIAAAPLLGLLGTVSGMVATFEGLTSMSLYTEGGGVAAGISMALLTTQAGLMIAIPAFFVSRVLSRKVRKFEQKAEAVLLTRAGERLAPTGSGA